MSKFDTHGGYFAPDGYMKVNEGGSHEENPNGGVQVGVDPEGNPNLLEEGEPVYNDYVYSDNITAEREFLEQNNLPGKYEGKLYSKIADDILTEAEERPLDPISRNSLEVLLGRLAEAQEGQKQRDQQKELEEELARLSPEELDQLEAMLAQGEQPIDGVDAGAVGLAGPAGPEGIVQAPTEPMPAEGMPMMANGGPLGRFDPFLKKRFPDEPSMQQQFEYTLLKDMVPEMPDFYPYDFETRVKAQRAINDEISRRKFVERMRKREDIEKKIIDKLDEFDDKYLGNRFIREYESGPRVGEKRFGIFATGGPKKTMADEVVSEILAEAKANERASGIGNTDLPLVTEHPGLDLTLAIAQPGTILEKALAPFAYRGIANGLANGEDAIQLFAPLAKIGKGVKAALSATEIANINGKIADYGKDIALAEKELAALKKELDVVKKGGPGSKDVIKSGIEKANERIRFAKREQGRLQSQLPKAESVVETVAPESPVVENTGGSAKRVLGSIVDPVGHILLKRWQPAGKAGKIAKGVVSGTGDLMLLDAALQGGRALYDEYAAPDGTSSSGLSEYNGFYSEPEKAYGGRINRFDFGDFLRRVQGYTPSTYRGGISGTYAIDKAFDLGKYKSIEDLEQSEAYDAFTKYVMRNSNDPNVRAYLQALDKGTNQDNGVPLLFDDNGNLVENWKDLYYQRRYDQTPGIYHLNPDEIYVAGPNEPLQIIGPNDVQLNRGANTDDWNAARAWNLMGTINPTHAYVARALAKNGQKEGLVGNPLDVSPDSVSENTGGAAGISGGSSGADEYGVNLLPTWPRYAGAVGSGLLGLYNAFQQPDKYTQQRLNPQLPEGRIHLQNQVYNPIDQNMVANSIAAQGNATNRALRNSGLGPSSAAAILAADNNTTGNLGTGFIQAWDANNQRRNAVIAANNQAEAQRANFDWTVDQQRKAILNDAAYKNAYNDLMLQRLNYAAEGDKYTAISNQINNGLQALSGIGKENFAMNQINTNPSFLNYRVAPNGQMIYNPWIAACGGFLKKLKK